ncbi:response regulator [bacterium]|nr:MAG: response regulator [bacterium]
MKDKLTVLIVEDEILTAKMLKMDLEELGVNVLKTVAKGEDAVKVALQENPSLILMDIRLAGCLDGIEAAEKIYQEKMIPIVFMTGYATDEMKERAFKLDPIDYLDKPVNMYRIQSIITHLTETSP